MKIRTGANQRINEGEKRKKKKPQPASQSSEMGNESKHGKFVNDAKDGNSLPFPRVEEHLNNSKRSESDPRQIRLLTHFLN